MRSPSLRFKLDVLALFCLLSLLPLTRVTCGVSRGRFWNQEAIISKYLLPSPPLLPLFRILFLSVCPLMLSAPSILYICFLSARDAALHVHAYTVFGEADTLATSCFKRKYNVFACSGRHSCNVAKRVCCRGVCCFLSCFPQLRLSLVNTIV